MMLLDSNILIYSVTPQYRELLLPYIQGQDNAVSLISKLEVLGFHRLLDADKAQFVALFDRISVLPVPEQVIEAAIALRQQKSLSVGDAIIAATALEHELPLVTRNTGDFKWIEGLQLVNPFDD